MRVFLLFIIFYNSTNIVWAQVRFGKCKQQLGLGVTYGALYGGTTVVCPPGFSRNRAVWACNSERKNVTSPFISYGGSVALLKTPIFFPFGIEIVNRGTKNEFTGSALDTVPIVSFGSNHYQLRLLTGIGLRSKRIEFSIGVGLSVVERATNYRTLNGGNKEFWLPTKITNEKLTLRPIIKAVYYFVEFSNYRFGASIAADMRKLYVIPAAGYLDLRFGVQIARKIHTKTTKT